VGLFGVTGHEGMLSCDTCQGVGQSVLATIGQAACSASPARWVSLSSLASYSRGF